MWYWWVLIDRFVFSYTSTLASSCPSAQSLCSLEPSRCAESCSPVISQSALKLEAAVQMTERWDDWNNNSFGTLPVTRATQKSGRLPSSFNLEIHNVRWHLLDVCIALCCLITAWERKTCFSNVILVKFWLIHTWLTPPSTLWLADSVAVDSH